MAIIGFNEIAYTFEEGDGTVEVCAAFLNPTQIAPNVAVELMGSTSPSTYPACCVNVYSTVSLTKEYPWVEHLTNLWGVGALSSVSYSNHKRVPISYVKCT